MHLGILVLSCNVRSVDDNEGSIDNDFYTNHKDSSRCLYRSPCVRQGLSPLRESFKLIESVTLSTETEVLMEKLDAVEGC